MGKELIMNNVVSKGTLRKIQSKTLNELSSILTNSFGPYGSNACIKKENALSRYTKDGHSIIGSIHYNGIIEQSIKDDIESITRHIVKTVGDGTTSAVILSSLIFDKINNLENDNTPPVKIITTLQEVVDNIKEEILKLSNDFTVDDAYDIAMISTNGNEFISNTIRDIYKEFGSSVFIDVSPSTGEDTIIKSYNGMTLNSGYCDSCYVTNSKNNTAEVDKPEVYFFEHPIDTRELGVYLDAILSRNIITPVNKSSWNEIIPTVIFAPRISQDMSSIMDSLTSTMASMPTSNKLPVCIVTDYHDTEQLVDLSKMCGAKLIRKYIDSNVYKQDVERGVAPTTETIFNWAGHCDRVVSYSDKTVFIRPHDMYNEDGSYSNLYNNMISFLESEIYNCTKNGEDAHTIGKLKRRLHSLKSNMVEIFVGGITQADRDALRDLVEDAVLNIRSAAHNGVGFGANMSGAYAAYKVSSNYISSNEELDLKSKLSNCIREAYVELLDILFNNSNLGKIGNYAITTFSDKKLVYNIRTDKWTNDVKTSIMSDIVVLDTVCKIIGIMVTCNQFILPTAMHNVYEQPVTSNTSTGIKNITLL